MKEEIYPFFQNRRKTKSVYL